MERADFLAGATFSAVAFRLPASSLGRLEARYGGRLGVVAVNSATGERIAHRAGERFPMCSTFKLLLVAAVLARVDSGHEQLNRRIPYGQSDLLPYAPVTRANLAQGSMTIQALCEAATVESDNTAANVLLRTIGGPPAVTAYARSLGDTRTRLDRNEPGLNSAIPGDGRDTTTPAAMTADLQKLLTGRALAPPSRAALGSWLIACRTGLDAIRAGVPANWKVGDKTGSGAYATSNDVAVLYPPARSPIFVAAYYTGSSATEEQRHAVLAQVGHLVSSRFG